MSSWADIKQNAHPIKEFVELVAVEFIIREGPGYKHLGTYAGPFVKV